MFDSSTFWFLVFVANFICMISGLANQEVDEDGKIEGFWEGYRNVGLFVFVGPIIALYIGC